MLNTLSEMARGQISELSKIAPLKPYVDDLQSALDGVSAKVAKFSKELDKVITENERLNFSRLHTTDFSNLK